MKILLTALFLNIVKPCLRVADHMPWPIDWFTDQPRANGWMNSDHFCYVWNVKQCDPSFIFYSRPTYVSDNALGTNFLWVSMYLAVADDPSNSHWTCLEWMNQCPQLVLLCIVELQIQLDVVSFFFCQLFGFGCSYLLKEKNEFKTIGVLFVVCECMW